MILFKVTYDINQSVSKPRLVNILPLPSNFLLKKKKICWTFKMLTVPRIM